MEHSIDLYAAYLQLAQATGDAAWADKADYARKFVLGLWHQAGGHFWTGSTGEYKNATGKVVPDGVNKGAIPLDVQAWALLSLGHDAEFRKTIGWQDLSAQPKVLEWIEKNCRLEKGPGRPSTGGFAFSEQGQGIWWEGSCHLALAYRYAGQPQRADAALAEVAQANPGPSPSQPDTSPGIPAAWLVPTYTGFIREFAPKLVRPWTYPPLPHIGATAWFLLAHYGVQANPYWFGTPPVTPHWT